jgi:gamma-glutamyltranspeptidase/glutathione hydrolase
MKEPSLFSIRPRVLATLITFSLYFSPLSAQVNSSQTLIPEPEMFSRIIDKKLVSSKSMMVVTANTYASEAAYGILNNGGNAVDAAIAASIMLTLTEPNATGIGGGGFLVHYDANIKKIKTYDGRETAPALANPERFLLTDGLPMRFEEAMTSGKSIGTPGLLKMLEQVHQAHGKLPWEKVLEPTIQQAINGFIVSDRLHTLIQKDPYLKKNPEARKYFYDDSGKAIQTGTLLKNPQLAKVLREIAVHGSGAFYTGLIAKDIVKAVQMTDSPGDLSEQDLLAYQSKERGVLCHSYRSFNICGMPPPSSGTLAILQMLGILETFPMSDYPVNTWQAVHLFSEAGRLAFADRDEYITDPDFVVPPIHGMLDANYLKKRRGTIRWDQSLQKALPGKPEGIIAEYYPDSYSEPAGTSHISVIDSLGNAVSLTNTIESQFGSRIMVSGFLLNNQLTDFSLVPSVDGKKVVNRVEANKRPRSSMAPLLVFNQQGDLIMNLGSAGGSGIINYVAKTLVAYIDWQMNIQEAISLPNFGSRNRETELEQFGNWSPMIKDLKDRGHLVRYFDSPSGLQGITRGSKISEGRLSMQYLNPSNPKEWVLFGGADPRREGVVLGD